MNKFKSGDKVKRIEEDFNGCLVGEIHVVRDYARPHNLRLEGFDADNVFMEQNFELVKEEEMNKMPELQTGNRVKCRNGKVFVYIKDLDSLYTRNGFMNLEDTDRETGKIKGDYMADWDIVQVYSVYTNGLMLDFEYLGDLIWKYKEPVVPTEADKLREEMSVLKARLRELGEE